MNAPNSSNRRISLDPGPFADSHSHGSSASPTLEKERIMPDATSSLVDAGEKDFRLTPLERRIVALSVAGYSRQQCAKRVGVSAPALKLHLSGIYDKLRVSNPLEMILFALYHQLIDSAADT